eukprot:CFRG7475T1
MSGTFKNKVGFELYYRNYFAVPAKGNIFVVNGLGEHSGTSQYQNHLVPYLVNKGFNVLMMDSQGHGKSEGYERTYVKKLDHYVADYIQFVHLMLDSPQHVSEVPNFIIGHSLGCITGFEIVRNSPDLWAGAIYNGGPFCISEEFFTPTFRFTCKVLSVIMPKIELGEKTDYSKVSRNPQEKINSEQDEFRPQGKIRARVAQECLTHVERIKNIYLAEFKTPVFIIHGEKDGICDWKGSQYFHDNCGSVDKTIKIYPEMLHETFADPDNAIVLGDIERWLMERINKSDVTSPQAK